jgi:CMP-N,N'-diacetyllegionaminic acid synthase
MLAIIPARGGSKGLPKKNIRPMAGEPLIAHSIKAALQATSITEVVVSTDDPEIARIAEEYGASVPFLRPDHLSQDNSLAKDAYIYTVEELKKRNPRNDYSNVAVLLPTSPLRTPEDIDAAVKLFHDRDADSVVSYAEMPHPVQWVTRIDENGKFLDLRNDLKNRQSYEVYYYPVGAIYVFRYSLLKTGKYYSDNSYCYAIPKSRAVEIDTLEDFLYAEVLLIENRKS